MLLALAPFDAATTSSFKGEFKGVKLWWGLICPLVCACTTVFISTFYNVYNALYRYSNYT